MRQYISNLVNRLKSKDNIFGVPNAIPLGITVIGFAFAIYGITLLNSMSKDFERYYATSAVIRLCGDYENNYQSAIELGHLEVAEMMKETCDKTIDELLGD